MHGPAEAAGQELLALKEVESDGISLRAPVRVPVYTDTWIAESSPWEHLMEENAPLGANREPEYIGTWSKAGLLEWSRAPDQEHLRKAPPWEALRAKAQQPYFFFPFQVLIDRIVFIKCKPT